ncbi:MAG: hypothetical protein AB4911_03950 [Oscillochloridaceae bacterium umkhey_bin13]
MVTSKQLPNGSVTLKPKRRGMGGAAALFMLVILMAGVIAIAGVGLFAPARLAIVHEQALGLIHGGIASTNEETYVDGCVSVPGLDGRRAITRTHRTVTFRNGTTLEVVFSGAPAPTNACP